MAASKGLAATTCANFGIGCGSFIAATTSSAMDWYFSPQSTVMSSGWAIPLYAAISFSSRRANSSMAAWVCSVEITSVGQAQTFPIGIEP